MVVIEKRHTVLHAGVGNVLDALESLVRLGTVGICIAENIRKRNIVAADLRIFLGNRVDSAVVGILKLLDGGMSRHCLQSEFIENRLELLGSIIVKSIRLNAVVSHIRDFLQSSAKVRCAVVTHRKELHSYRKFHDFYLPYLIVLFVRSIHGSI